MPPASCARVAQKMLATCLSLVVRKAAGPTTFHAAPLGPVPAQPASVSHCLVPCLPVLLRCLPAFHALRGRDVPRVGLQYFHTRQGGSFANLMLGDYFCN